MELTLVIDGKKKKFKQPAFMPAIRFKQSLQWVHALDTDFSNETLDGAVEFIANDLYACKFSAEEFWNGLDAGEVMGVIMNALASPSKRAEEKMAALKN